MTIVLYSCSTTTIKPKIPELDPLAKITFPKPSLDLLGFELKKIVLDRIWNCEDRLETLKGQIKSYNER